MKKVSVIIPFFNEAENIKGLVNQMSDFFSKRNEFQGEVIFVDDGSTDGSLDLLRKLRHSHYEVRVVKFSRNFGSHAALRAGILNSTGDFVCFIYADLQDPLELIYDLYRKCEEGYDIVWATRRKAKVFALGKIFSKLYALMMRKFVVPGFPENGFDIVMFTNKVRREVNDNIEANSSLFLQILFLGFNQTWIVYDKVQRRVGKSKWTVAKKLKLFIDSFVAFTYAPIRFVTVVGITLFVSGFFWAIYILGRVMILSDLNQGWPALICVLVTGFGVTNISLGIIAEYLWRTLDAARKRKVFVIDEVIQLSSTDGN